jgi:hypothetical protein
MEGPLLEVWADTIFLGHLVGMSRENALGGYSRSYDHRGQGYGWVPAKKDLDWCLDVERLQGPRVLPLARGSSELAFLCQWTRCETIAKLIQHPVLILWKQFKNCLSEAPGNQSLIVGEKLIYTHVLLYEELVISLAHD